jgi:hypothetical protein
LLTYILFTTTTKNPKHLLSSCKPGQTIFEMHAVIILLLSWMTENINPSGEEFHQ